MSTRAVPFALASTPGALALASLALVFACAEPATVAPSAGNDDPRGRRPARPRNCPPHPARIGR